MTQAMTLRVWRRAACALFATWLGFALPACHADESNVTSKRATATPAQIPARAAAQTSQQRRGAELYGRMCVVCHGVMGEGYKADNAPAIGAREFLGSVNDEFLRSAIVSGRQGTTMSAWANDAGGPLSSDDVEAVIAFLRSLSHEPKLSLDERALRGNVPPGAALFATHCASCHGARGMLGPYVHIGNRQLLNNASDGFLRGALVHGRTIASVPSANMPSFAAALGDQGVEDVVAYLRYLQDSAPLAAAPARPPPPLPLGPVPLHPHGPEPRGFQIYPGLTSVDVVHAELARGARMALLDARAPSDYANEHIALAVSVPFYDPAPYLAKLPKDAWLVCYCACPHAESGELALKLMAAGFTKVTVLAEGLSDWVVKKHRTHQGPKP